MNNRENNLQNIIKRRWQKHNQNKLLTNILSKLALGCVGFLFLVIFAGIVFVAWLSMGLPSMEEIRNLSFTESTQILDREGNILYTIHGEENRSFVPFEEISPSIVKATISMEDKNFYEHHGFYLKRIIAAIINNLQGKPVQGASTITQQFVKNVFLSSERTLERKLKELILAIKVERGFEKDEIMELYLNAIPYGNNAYGIQQAAKIYFNKDAKDLTLAQSAMIAALPNAPSRYNPYGSHRYPYLTKEFTPEEIKRRNIQKENDLKSDEFSRGLLGKVIHLDEKHSVYIRGRADIVLANMYEDESITKQEKQDAWEELQAIEFSKYREKIAAPHFVFYVRELLEEKYGKEVIQKGGFKVYTTLDPKYQEAAEKAVHDNLERNKGFGANNAAFVAIDPNNGQILAMIGSADYWNEEIDGNVNVATRERQPGSAFKPFIYAKLFTAAPYGPATPLYDLQTDFGGDKPPKNFDGGFRGQITIRQALGKSINIPAIKAYFLAGEEQEIIPFVNKFGIAINPQRYYGWPLALGTAEVKLLDITAGFGVFASTGKLYPKTAILKVINSKGDIIEEWKKQRKPPYVIDPQIAFLINDILADPEIHLGKRLRLENHIVAAKTGTSTKKDPDDPKGEDVVPSNTWAFMYTADIVTGVWVGNTDGSALKYEADGYSNAAPIAGQFLTEVLADQPKKEFVRPSGVERITVSRANGKLPGPLTPQDMFITDYYASFSKPTEIDHDFKEATIDTITKELATPYCPAYALKTAVFRDYHEIESEKYPRWNASVQIWAAEQEDRLPQQPCSIHNKDTFDKQPSITIVEPLNLGSIQTGTILVKVRIGAPHGVEKVEFFLNDNLQFIAQGPPYNGLMRLSPLAKIGSRQTITAKVTDKLGYVATSTIEVQVKNPQKIIDEIGE